MGATATRRWFARPHGPDKRRRRGWFANQGKLLGHTQARTTQRYARHLADDPLRAAATKITNAITSATGPRLVSGTQP